MIKEFIDALAIEIETLKDALKKGKGGNIVTVYNGELIRKTLDFFIYQFTLENFLIALDDTPAKIEVNGIEYECDIISVTGQQVQISIKQKLPGRIPVAKIQTNTWYLLEILKKKYEDNINSQSRFDNSNKLFHYRNSMIDGGKFNTSYSIDREPPNPSQHKAIESSINEFISIIWGPPGTGKTVTIAKAIESHLNLGRKVLLLSHANNAVDQALLKVAAQMKKNYYNEGQLVRLGTPKAEMLTTIEATCPLVLIDKIAEFKSKELIREKEELNRNLESIQVAKQSYENIIFLNGEITKIKLQLEKEAKEIKNQESKLFSVNNEIGQLQNKINEFREKLSKAQHSGFVKRKFLGLDPVKIETNLKILYSDFSVRSNQVKNLEQQIEQIRFSMVPRKIEMTTIESELSNQLSKIGKYFTDVQSELNESDNRVKKIQSRLNEISKAIEEIKIKILSDSKLVATTLTKSYISKEIESIEFDILIVDEVSMAPMPMLYWAASKVKKGITLVGDFNQLPPICISKDDLVIKWLGKSILDHLGITLSNASVKTKLLNIQYRMNPLISEIPRTKIYNNLLRDDPKETIKKYKDDDFIGTTPICLVDTSSHNPWCSQFEVGGRFNLISALICVSLAEKISKTFSINESIGIITPYRNQARLILKIAEDKGLINKNQRGQKLQIRVNTIHSFQGGEETAIIFDSVEGEGAKKWSMLNEYNNTESAIRLINVAMTRAETKLYIVANFNYIKINFARDTLFMDVLRHVIAKGKEVKSTEIISNLRDENFEYWISKLNTLKNRPENFGTSFTDQDFWPAFHNDLGSAEKELIIFSPFLTSERFGKLHLIFSELLSKGVHIYVITLAPNEQPLVMQGAKEVMTKLKEIGVVVKFRHAMHEKIALIDGKIKWIGSLNILSHNTKKEYMERVEGESAAKELFDRFNLEDLLMNQNINGEICPKCKSNFISSKFSFQNGQYFYSCSGYPDCDFTANIKTRTLNGLNEGTRTTRPQNTPRANNRRTNMEQNSSTIIIAKGKQWESPLCYWSSVQLPGYRYSKKKNAWWKKK